MAGVKGMRHSRKMPEAYKVNISTAKIAERLEKHIFGEIKMEPSAVTAALGLLRKRLPDLAATTLSGDSENPLVQEIRRTVIAARNSSGNSDSGSVPPAT